MKFDWSIRVYIEDTDMGGIVYYANYLKFMERARTEWLRSMDFHQDRLREQGLLFVVTESCVKYKKPARLDDELVIRTQVSPSGKTRMQFDQSIVRFDDTGGEELVASGMVTVASITTAGRPCQLPASVRDCLSIDTAE